MRCALMASMSRTKRLREERGWEQREMAEYLGAHQSTVSRLESGVIPETGPWSRLLDVLEASADKAKPKIKGAA